MQYTTFTDWLNAETEHTAQAANLRETRVAFIQAIHAETEQQGSGDPGMLQVYRDFNEHYLTVADDDRKGWRDSWSVKLTRAAATLAKADPFWKGRSVSVVIVDDGIAVTFPLKRGGEDISKTLERVTGQYIAKFGPDRAQREMAELIVALCDNARSVGLAAELAAGARRQQQVDDDRTRASKVAA